MVLWASPESLGVTALRPASRGVGPELVCCGEAGEFLGRPVHHAGCRREVIEQNVARFPLLGFRSFGAGVFGRSPVVHELHEIPEMSAVSGLERGQDMRWVGPRQGAVQSDGEQRNHFAINVFRECRLPPHVVVDYSGTVGAAVLASGRR